ncbi:MAG: RDD family protein [Betaproteobacteria bacterium]
MSLGRGTGPVDPPQAGIARRLAASLYEVLLLCALAVAVGLVLLPVLGADTAKASGALTLPRPSGRVISFACLFAVFGAYCIWLWSGDRRTLPMRTWGLILVTTAGGAVSLERAAARYVAGWVGPTFAIAAYLALRPYGHRRWALALLAANYVWAFVDRDRRFLHDRLAGTRLVRAGRAWPRTAAAGAPPEH